ncbi:DUF2218 domain-containing protein [Paracoccus tibetensis]|uniref:DUF2218 domain-containing protein n=1 Tax=Paracoccus tibetensis TaxID=336292 RepID=A0A1G5FVZ6_9RHOB|nr:DUF2218 domain-containing protein [Paracoccus tibetensis]SCY43010.1 hypothetical protein SAMN05660710_01576 [Paracoccus tibetensis]
MKTNAIFPTARPAALRGTMAKHFSHKISVTDAATRAEFRFDDGLATLAEVPEGLALTVEAADAATQVQLQDVLERHLLRFAHREAPAPLVWSPA